jgi:hypothetical protein
VAVQTVRPNAEIQGGDWIDEGGAGSKHNALADASDSTYVRNTSNSNKSSYRAGLPTATIGSDRVLRARLRYRAQKLIAGQNINQYLEDNGVSSQKLYQSNANPIQDFTGPWWTTNANGSEWTAAAAADRLIYVLDITDVSGAPDSDAWRMYAVYVDYDVRALLTLGAPTATNTGTARPTINWSATLNADGDPQKRYQIYVYSSAVYSLGGFSPGVSSGWSWSSGEVSSSSARSAVVGSDLAFGTTYRAYVRLAQDFNGQSWWTAYQNVQFTVAVPGGSTPQPTTPTLTRTVDDPGAKVLLSVTTVLNLMTAQQSSLESSSLGTTGWAAGADTTITRDVTQAGHLLANLKLTKAVSTGPLYANTLTGTSGVPVRGGAQYTALASFRAAATARACRVRIAWYDSAGVFVSDALGGDITDTTSGWTQAACTATAPATAAFAAIEVQAARPGTTAAAISEVHFVDKVDLHPGAGTTWTLGGYIDAIPPTAELVVEFQDTLGPNFAPANVADGGDSLGTTDGWHRRTAGDLLELNSSAALQGARAIRWGPSAASSVLDVGFLTTSANYDQAPLAAPGRSMVASAWIRTESGSVSVTLGIGAHNNAGAVGSIANGSAVTATTTWQRITSGVLSVGDTALYHYLAFDNTGDTTTLRILIDKVQVEVAGAASTDWVSGTGDRPADWSHVRTSPILGSTLPLEQQITLHDHETHRDTGIRIYRASVSTLDLDNISVVASNYAMAAAHNDSDVYWWLKDPLTPALAFTSTHFLDPASEDIDEDVETVHPLGRPYPVSVSSWISAGDSGQLSIMATTEAEWAQLRNLLRLPRPLYLQSPFGWNRYIRVTARPWSTTSLVTGLARTVEITYHDEARP